MRRLAAIGLALAATLAAARADIAPPLQFIDVTSAISPSWSSPRLHAAEPSDR